MTINIQKSGQKAVADSSPLPAGAIRFENVTKTYQIMQRATPRLGAWLVSKMFEYLRREPFDALREISFSVQPGEMLGLVGHNGAGKSTILKLVAGITHPTSGSVEVSGQVASLLELGVGFHEDLSGMENIFYNGAMMGLTRQEILDRLPDIIGFSGLEPFIYEAVKHYSSGMYSRLACSVALHLNPQIILVDEILAVGDADFQQRGIMKILELNRSGVTTLIVTHEVAAARDLCDRLIWVDGGRLLDDGDPRRIHNEYIRSVPRRINAHSIANEPLPPEEERMARLAGARFFVEGVEASALNTGQECRLEIDLEGTGEVCIGLVWLWTDGRVLTQDTSPPLHLGGARLTIPYAIPRWPLARCKASVTIVLLDASTGFPIDRQPEAITVEVETPGFVDIDVLERPVVKWSMRGAG